MKRNKLASFALILLFLSCCTTSQQSSYNGGGTGGAKEEEVEVGKEIWAAYTQVITDNTRQKLELRWLGFDVPGDKRYYTYEEVKSFIDSVDNDEYTRSFSQTMAYARRMASAKEAQSQYDFYFPEKDVFGNVKSTPAEKEALVFYVNASKCYNHNKKDVPAAAGCKEQYTHEVERAVFGVDNDLVSLVLSPHYAKKENKGTILPDVVIKYTNSAFQTVKGVLPDSIKKIVNDTQLVIGNSSLGTHQLWLEVVDKKVYISPFLVRAAFVMACNKYPNIMAEYKDLSEGTSKRLRGNTAEDYRSINQAVLSEMQRNLSFPFGHELAHIYLNKKSTLLDESLCDCNSIYYLKKNKVWFSLDFFNQTLRSAVVSGGNFWGFEEVGDLEARFAQIDKISKQDTVKCK
ncbi:hypothetical protein Q5H92_13810 [Hymenobacter sp. M29]|uniref:Lipoprotein n=1 Tax=Hymenobacter mellowenesis TaxID=3063995 RepID=A0ABT9AC76_9BACT|nr:hypothetical protein [Hymenobacter sp. M29]MDO7847441.1 hypothetical protein [Hymenobacter sp. M29]